MEQIEIEIKNILQQALREDIGNGDVTTNCIVPYDAICQGEFLAKESGVIAGLEVAKLIFLMLDENVRFMPQVKDGARLNPGSLIAKISGRAQALLSGERVALNFLQRMSGIATLTRKFVEAVKGTSAIILDTRKTAPGLRLLDKWAVRIGGGQNHRSGLWDMILIKENHIKVAGSISKAVAMVRERDLKDKFIEVEVKDLSELQEALALKVDRILLDNMSLLQLQEAVCITHGRIPLEASGNINLKNVAEIAATGVDYISVGMLTHSVRALDISFLLDLHYS